MPILTLSIGDSFRGLRKPAARLRLSGIRRVVKPIIIQLATWRPLPLASISAAGNASVASLPHNVSRSDCFHSASTRCENAKSHPEGRLTTH